MKSTKKRSFMVIGLGTFGDTRVVSNPRGYPLRTGAFECKGYDDQGMIIEV